MLQFFRDAKPIKSYALRELIDPALMRQTVVGFYWGSYLGLEHDRFLIELVDGPNSRSIPGPARGCRDHNDSARLARTARACTLVPLAISAQGVRSFEHDSADAHPP